MVRSASLLRRFRNPFPYLHHNHPLRSTSSSSLSSCLETLDPEIHALIRNETRRQPAFIDLTATSNFVSFAVASSISASSTANNQIELICASRALQLFRLDPAAWGVNVRLDSGDSAVFAACDALLNPGDRIMGLHPDSGGHLSHGYFHRPTWPDQRQLQETISAATSTYFDCSPYFVNPATGLVDYDELEKKAMRCRPKLILCGGRMYPRDWDYARFRDVADKCGGASLLCDMSTVSGLVAAEQAANPFDYCDVVTTSAHESLRGPRSGMIFYKKKGIKATATLLRSLRDHGGCNHQIAALAVALKQALSPGFRAYARQVKANADVLAKYLISKGHKIVTSGTDNHLLLWDLRPICGLHDAVLRMEKIFNACNIMVDRTTLSGDNIHHDQRSLMKWFCQNPGALEPSGLCIGTHAMTSRGLIEEDFEQIADFLHRIATLVSTLTNNIGTLMSRFSERLENNNDVEDLKEATKKFIDSLEMHGSLTSNIKHKD